MPKTANTNRVTAVYLDGNSIMAAVVSLGDGGTPRIHALRLIETQDLVERVDRIPHPIFMNTERLVFPMQDILSQALGVLLDGEEFNNPLVGVLPPDLLDMWTDETPCTPREQQKRVYAGIKAVLDGNPYGYPKLLSFDLIEDATERTNRVRLWSCRFDDVLGMADQLLRLDMPFVGIVTAQRALTEIVHEIADPRAGAPLIVIDIGKLRTSYTGISSTRRTLTHAIPVGLARDANRYFASFTPTLANLRELHNHNGNLFIPPDYTPSGLFDAYPATPQMEVTHFAGNVSEYANRLLASVRGNNEDAPPPVVVMTGLAAAVPGLREYLESRTTTVIQPFEEQHGRQWQYEDPELAGRVRNHLPAIGGALAFLRRTSSHYGIVMRERRPRRFPITAANLPTMEPQAVYVLEWGGHSWLAH